MPADPTAPLPDEELAAIEADLAKYPDPSRNGPHDPLEYARVLLAALRAERAAPLDVERQLDEYRENMQRLAVALDQQDRDFAARGLSLKTLARVFSETTVLRAVSASTARRGTMLPNTAREFAESIAAEYARLAPATGEGAE